MQEEGLYINYYEPMSRIKPTLNPSTNQTQNTPSNFQPAPVPPPTIGTEYTQGYLRTQIGKRMRVTFLLGTNIIQDRTGVLNQVGISYIILIDDESQNLELCDIYSIKFVNIFS
jgi:hypothetical protein